MKDKKFIFASILVAVFLLTVGLTYAYFSLTISGNDVAETINVSTTKIGLIYTDGNEIKVNGIEPKWTTTKTITVENTGNEEAYYALGWQKLYNEIQKDELVIRSTCTSSGVTGGTCSSIDNVVIPQTSEVTAETNTVLYPYKENVLILPSEKHTYTVTIEFINYEDKAQNYNQGKKFYGVLGAAESSKKVTLSNYILENYSTLGLTKIDRSANEYQNYSSSEYRYQGKNPNNYITFNEEEGVWRIIGVFEVETPNSDGTYTRENRVKIIRDTVGETNFGGNKETAHVTNRYNTVLTSSISNDYSKIAAPELAPLEFDTTYVYRELKSGKYQLNSSAWNYIDNTKWSIGAIKQEEYIGNVYNSERKSTYKNSYTWDGDIGLPLVSDYISASNLYSCYSETNTTNKISEYSTVSENGQTCIDTNWMATGYTYYTISHGHVDSGSVYENNRNINGVNAQGNIELYDAYLNYNVSDPNYLNIRPVVYLKSSIKKIKGNGKISNPYILE